jgi:hypothetical protein
MRTHFLIDLAATLIAPEVSSAMGSPVNEARHLCFHIEVSHLISHLVAVASIEITIKKQ